MLLRLPRPWSDAPLPVEEPFRRSDCLLSESDGRTPAGEHVVLMSGKVRDEEWHLLQHPYPKKLPSEAPDRVGFPLRPRRKAEQDGNEEVMKALERMNEVTARVQELGEALDDPSTLWQHLATAWERAEDEEDPRMAEIVRQAREMAPQLKQFRDTIRRVLRRHRELTPLDRVQEMDRASMQWLSRQPGRSTAERAGAQQRILAVARHENFDTLENRVAHAYLLLAADVGREWLRAYSKAVRSSRYQDVSSYVKLCKNLASDLNEMGVGIASTDITPNYVLLENRVYRSLREAWEALLRREKALDDLWAWQAQTWTDFSVLALVLALNEMEGAELVAQAPIQFRDEAVNGIWFDQDRPIAVFWIKSLSRVVEVMARPEKPGPLLTLARAHVAMRISDPFASSTYPHRVAVWTPHAMDRIDITKAADEAVKRIDDLKRFPSQTDRIRHGLILTPGHHAPQSVHATRNGAFVEAIAFDAMGPSLKAGRAAIHAFLQRDIWGGA